MALEDPFYRQLGRWFLTHTAKLFRRSCGMILAVAPHVASDFPLSECSTIKEPTMPNLIDSLEIEPYLTHDGQNAIRVFANEPKNGARRTRYYNAACYVLCAEIECNGMEDLEVKGVDFSGLFPAAIKVEANDLRVSTADLKRAVFTAAERFGIKVVGNG